MTVRTMQAPGEDDLGSLGLQPDDQATTLGVAGAVELDLPVELGPVQHRPLDPIRVVAGQLRA